MLDEQLLEQKPPSVKLKKVVTFKEDVRELKLDNKIICYHEGLDFIDSHADRKRSIRELFGSTKEYLACKERLRQKT